MLAITETNKILLIFIDNVHFSKSQPHCTTSAHKEIERMAEILYESMIEYFRLNDKVSTGEKYMAI